MGFLQCGVCDLESQPCFGSCLDPHCRWSRFGKNSANNNPRVCGSGAPPQAAFVVRTVHAEVALAATAVETVATADAESSNRNSHTFTSLHSIHGHGA
jgi:hypothetical protein